MHEYEHLESQLEKLFDEKGVSPEERRLAASGLCSC